MYHEVTRFYDLFHCSNRYSYCISRPFPEQLRYPWNTGGNSIISVNYGTGSCEGVSPIWIGLSTSGKINADYDMEVTIWVTGPNTCKVGNRLKVSSGSHDNTGTFVLPIEIFGSGFVVPITGTFDDSKITGTGSTTSADGFLTVTLSFSAQVRQPPKITLEPATYPDFQLSILAGTGFTVKIRKEDGVKDSQGNWKLNWSSLAFVTDGTDNSMDFIKTVSTQDIVRPSESEDGKEVRFDIRPDPKLFMLEQNVFNIKNNGIHTIGLSVCDTDGRCGGSNYTIYFGPFIWAEEVSDERCDDSAFSNDLLIKDCFLGNIGHTNPKNALYIALQNAVNLENIWFYYISFLGAEIWKEGSPLPIVPEEFEMVTGDVTMVDGYLMDLKCSLHYNEPIIPTKNQEFPAGNYNFYAVLVDTRSNALEGFCTMPVKTCLFFD